MAEFSKYIGLDVHKERIAVAAADGGRGAPRYWGEIDNSAEAVGRLLERLGRNGERLRFCYEADRAATGCTARSRPPVTLARSWPRR